MFWFAAYIYLNSIAVVKPTMSCPYFLSGSPEIDGLHFQLFKLFDTSKSAFGANPNVRTEIICSLVP
jgi:hypothetical protein